MSHLIVWHNCSSFSDETGNHYAYPDHHKTLCGVSFKNKNWTISTFPASCSRCLKASEKLIVKPFLSPEESHLVTSFGLIEPKKLLECSSYSVWTDKTGHRTITIGSESFTETEPTIEDAWSILRTKMSKLTHHEKMAWKKRTK